MAPVRSRHQAMLVPGSHAPTAFSSSGSQRPPLQRGLLGTLVYRTPSRPDGRDTELSRGVEVCGMGAHTCQSSPKGSWRSRADQICTSCDYT